MAPAARKTTGTSRPRAKGAASAVEDTTTVEAENIVEVDPNRQVHDADDAPATDIPSPEGAPAVDLDGEDAPAEDELVVDPNPAPAHPGSRDLSVLARLADTSGRSAVTPYPGQAAPSPVLVLPPLRDAHVWTRDGDEARTARVLVDGWRVQINAINRFARKGDRVTAPADVVEAAVARGSLAYEPEE